MAIPPKCTYVYASQSKAFPNLLKIGKADDLDEELALLNMGCTPTPHKFVATACTHDNINAERLTHNFFALNRKKGDFFEVSVEEVSNFLDKHIDVHLEYQLDEPDMLVWEEEKRRNAAIREARSNNERLKVNRKRVLREEQIFEMEMEERKQRLEERKQIFAIEMEERKKRLEEHIKNIPSTIQGGMQRAEDSDSDEDSD